jgi:hypothetical protein
MDASDKIRRDNSKAIWSNYKTTVLTPQGGSCPPASCNTSLNSACAKVNFTSYAQRNDVLIGRMNCDCQTNCQCS